MRKPARCRPLPHPTGTRQRAPTGDARLEMRGHHTHFHRRGGAGTRQRAPTGATGFRRRQSQTAGNAGTPYSLLISARWAGAGTRQRALQELRDSGAGQSHTAGNAGTPYSFPLAGRGRARGSVPLREMRVWKCGDTILISDRGVGTRQRALQELRDSGAGQSQTAGRSETAPYGCSGLPAVYSAPGHRRPVSDTPARALREAPLRPHSQRRTQDAELGTPP